METSSPPVKAGFVPKMRDRMPRDEDRREASAWSDVGDERVVRRVSRELGFRAFARRRCRLTRRFREKTQVFGDVLRVSEPTGGAHRVKARALAVPGTRVIAERRLVGAAIRREHEEEVVLEPEHVVRARTE